MRSGVLVIIVAAITVIFFFGLFLHAVNWLVGKIDDYFGEPKE